MTKIFSKISILLAGATALVFGLTDTRDAHAGLIYDFEGQGIIFFGGGPDPIFIDGTVEFGCAFFGDCFGDINFVMNFREAPNEVPVFAVDSGSDDMEFLLAFWAINDETWTIEGFLSVFLFESDLGSMGALWGAADNEGGIIALLSESDEFNLFDPDGFLLSGLSFNAVHIPEPGTLAIFGLGLIGLGFARRRRTV